MTIEVQFSFDLNGILTVTASETSTGRQEQLVVNDASKHRLPSHELERSRDAVESLFASLVDDDFDDLNAFDDLDISDDLDALEDRDAADAEPTEAGAGPAADGLLTS